MEAVHSFSPLAAPAAEAAGPGDGQDVQLLRQKVLAQGAELLGDLRGVLPRLPLLSPLCCRCCSSGISLPFF